MRTSAPRSLRRLLVAPFAAVALTAGLVATAGAAAAGPPGHHADGWDRSGDPLVVRTEAGAVRGTQAEGYRLFQGIPYAAPPVDELRFRPPQPVQPWEGVREATAPGSQCAQLARTTNPESFAEDCLYLNVTTPAGDRSREKLPVMVWFHGGSFVYGTGNDYDASALATEGDVVVVTINYRLGPLGFLAQEDLSAELGAVGSGSAALLDQQASLDWVEENIRAFGGNPRNVTIFGESAGAAAVCAQLVSPAAEGRFDRAIAQSYSCTSDFATLEEAEQTGAQVAEAVGCTHPATRAECLRTPGEDFVRQLLQAWGAAGGGAFVVGGEALPLQPAEAIAAGEYARVPVMHGNNRDENTLFTPLNAPAAELLGPDGAVVYERILTERYGERAADVLARYPVAEYSSPLRALAAVDSDATGALSTCAHVEAYEALSDRPQRSKVYAYQFRDRSAPPLIDVPALDEGASHASELPFLWPGLFGAPLTAEQEELSDAMVRYWTDFAEDGKPNGRGVPDWDRYSDPDDVQGLDLTSAGGIGPVDVAEDAQCEFWSTIRG